MIELRKASSLFGSSPLHERIQLFDISLKMSKKLIAKHTDIIVLKGKCSKNNQSSSNTLLGKSPHPPSPTETHKFSGQFLIFNGNVDLYKLCKNTIGANIKRIRINVVANKN